MFNTGLILKDASNRLVVAMTGAANFNGGTPVATGGELLVSQAGGVTVVNGLWFTVDGYVVVVDAGTIIAYVGGGFGVDVDGKLCIANGGTPAFYIAGIPFDANGRVCTTGLTPIPPGASGILQENSSFIFQENGDPILQE